MFVNIFFTLFNMKNKIRHIQNKRTELLSIIKNIYELLT
jgi:hypothetical protein